MAENSKVITPPVVIEIDDDVLVETENNSNKTILLNTSKVLKNSNLEVNVTIEPTLDNVIQQESVSQISKFYIIF